jgi:hypothetical protein
MKEIITVSIEKDLIDRLPPSPGRSAFVESAIRSALKREDNGMTTIRVKNVARVLELVEEHQYGQKAHLMKLAMLELGITQKRFCDYAELLAYNGRIIDQNGWLVSKSYSGPMPWTEEAKRLRAQKLAESVKRVEAKPVENESEVDDILNAEVGSDGRE